METALQGEAAVVDLRRADALQNAEGERILLVDDDEGVLLVHQRVLEVLSRSLVVLRLHRVVARGEHRLSGGPEMGGTRAILR